MLPLSRFYLLRAPGIKSRARICENAASYGSRQQLWLFRIAFILERFRKHRLYWKSRPTELPRVLPCASQLKSQQHVRVHLATARAFLFCRWGRWCQVAEAAAVGCTSGWSTCAAVIITLFSPPLGKSTALGPADKRSNFSYRLCLERCQTHFVSHNAPSDFYIWPHTSNFLMTVWMEGKLGTAQIPYFSNAYFKISGSRKGPLGSSFKLHYSH